MAESKVMWSGTFAGVLWRGNTTKTEILFPESNWLANSDGRDGTYFTEIKVYKIPLEPDQMTPSDVPGVIF